MTVEHVPARTDLTTPQAPPSAATAARTPFRRHGLMLTGGAIAWALVTLAVGVAPEGDVGVALYAVGSGAFQFGLLALLTVIARSQALGDGRLARFFVRFEMGLVTLAIASTAADGFAISNLDQPHWALLDAFWPFSMLGMFLIGVRIAIAGRWRGVERFYPLVAESWFVCVIPSIAVFGHGSFAVSLISATHLLIGYSVLGRIVARKQA